MGISEIRKVLKLSKQFGLKSVRLGEFEAHFSDVVAKPVSRGRPKGMSEPEAEGTLTPRAPTEEELLYWSTDYEPELDKKEQAEAFVAEDKSA